MKKTRTKRRRPTLPGATTTLIIATLLLAAGLARPDPANAREDCRAIKLDHGCLDPAACRIRENNYNACLKRNEAAPDLAADPNLGRPPSQRPPSQRSSSPTARNQSDLRAAARAMRAKYPPPRPTRPAPSARPYGPGPAPIPDACGLFNSCSK